MPRHARPAIPSAHSRPTRLAAPLPCKAHDRLDNRPLKRRSHRRARSPSLRHRRPQPRLGPPPALNAHSTARPAAGSFNQASRTTRLSSQLCRPQPRRGTSSNPHGIPANISSRPGRSRACFGRSTDASSAAKSSHPGNPGLITNRPHVSVRGRVMDYLGGARVAVIVAAICAAHLAASAAHGCAIHNTMPNAQLDGM